MKLNVKLNPMTCGKYNFTGGEFSIELTPSEVLSIGPQLKEVGNTINNGELISKAPELIEQLIKAIIQPTPQAPVAQPTPQPVPQTNSIPRPRVESENKTPATINLCEVPDEAPHKERLLSMDEIELYRKRAERKLIEKLFKEFESYCNCEHDSNYQANNTKLSWDNGEVRFDRQFPKLTIHFNASDEDEKDIHVAIYANTGTYYRDGHAFEEYKVADINKNTDLYDGIGLTFCQKKIMQKINAMIEKQLKDNKE